ncbi:exodeoxyribonuclease VII large subunit [Corynebacterium mendelii]|uniref:exodeoxyribonuclease VII large subunit n=1 Tax=Corynebacterium mendelii TaxID=2765362 RepID=UPI002ECFAF8F
MTVSAAPTVESPWSVGYLNNQIKGWIDRLGSVWVEGEITQAKSQAGWKWAYATLRDTGQTASIRMMVPKNLMAADPSLLAGGQRVIVNGKPSFYVGRGELSLWVSDIRPVGIGALQAKIDRLRGELSRQGLFDPRRKKHAPYLPGVIGLITGRGSHAERDVMQIATDRWPEVCFRVINTPVQGADAAPAIVDALRVLDADEEVEVIIIARGGGSVEDLLPFSEEPLVRAVAAAVTPVVSAIGHEPDRPILDDVADIRAATPTDAAKQIVPDAAEEHRRIAEARTRSAAALRGWVTTQQDVITALRQRPVLADPLSLIDTQQEVIDRNRTAARRCLHTVIGQAVEETSSLRARVAALGPAATLARGYSVVQVLPRDHGAPQVVTTIGEAPPGSQLRIRVTDGSIQAASIAVHPAD